MLAEGALSPYILTTGKMMERKKTRVISVGGVKIGGDNPITVQSMLKTDPQNLQETLTQLRDVKRAGCELIRIALPQEETCKIISFLKTRSRYTDHRGRTF